MFSRSEETRRRVSRVFARRLTVWLVLGAVCLLLVAFVVRWDSVRVRLYAGAYRLTQNRSYLERLRDLGAQSIPALIDLAYAGPEVTEGDICLEEAARIENLAGLGRALSSASREQDSRKKAAYCVLFGRLGDTQSLAFLNESIHDASALVRGAAASAIVDIRGAGAVAQVALMARSDPDPVTRMWCLEAVGRYKGGDVEEALRAGLQDEDSTVARAALRHLPDSPDETFVVSAILGMVKHGELFEEYRQTLEQAASIKLPALEHSNEEQRRQAGDAWLEIWRNSAHKGDS